MGVTQCVTPIFILANLYNIIEYYLIIISVGAISFARSTK